MVADTGEDGAKPLTRPCKKCNTREGTLAQRSDTVCRECFMHFVGNKCARHMGVVGRQTQPAAGQASRRYLMGLSLGTSSCVLLHLLDNYVESGLAKNRKVPFELDVVHVDTSMSEADENRETAVPLAAYQQRYPRFEIERVPLSEVLSIESIDWSALPPLKKDATRMEQIRGLFEQLPSTTSRADVMRLFVRQILLAKARQTSCQAVLFAHSTTALAEMTLAETAKGKGFSLPWLINDGLLPHAQSSAANDGAENATPSTNPEPGLRVQYPLRELLRREITTYSTLTSPPLTEMISADPPRGGSIVSHKDLSIDEVMTRYFQDVEEKYPSIIANVVRTTAKLNRVDAEGLCGLCGNPLDQQGDERWKGEIGDDGRRDQSLTRNRICYGCERSIHD